MSASSPLPAAAAVVAGLALALAACQRTEPHDAAAAATAAAAVGSAVAAAPVAAAAASASDARTVYEQAATGSGFAVGQPMSARTVYVFFDPQCPHCAALWKASQPLLDRVRMVWIPVAFVSPRSAPQGAQLLAAADPRAAMAQHEARLEAGQGGLATDAAPAADRLAQVKANTALIGRLGFDSVPTMVYRAGNAGPYGVAPGVLTTESLARTLGL